MKKWQTVFITGSSSGIGQETAYDFAQSGYNVIVTYRSSKKDGEFTAKRCLQLGATSVLLLKLDLLKDSSIKSAVKAVKKKYGSIDILINNAGYLVKKPLLKQTPKEIDLQIRTNLEALIKMTYYALPIIKKTIINISSRRGLLIIPDASVYGAAKWGVRGFTKDLALEHPKLHIVSVNPSLTATKMTKFEGMHPEKVAQVIFDVAVGKRKTESGDDVNLWEIYNVKPF